MLKTDQEYRSQIKQVGKYNLKDTHKWRERAIFFNENGYYTDLIEDTKDWDDFWDEEERRIQEGLWVDGFYIPGLYYFYLNYLPIYKKQENTYDFPDVYDMDYHTFLCLEHAVLLKLDFVVIKKRQCVDKNTFIYTPLGVETIENLCNSNYRGQVYSLDENKKLIVDEIIDIWKTKEVRELVKITLTGGKTLECTDEHKINTNKGWVKAGELKVKDVLYTIRPPFGENSISDSEAISMGYFFADGSCSKDENRVIPEKYMNLDERSTSLMINRIFAGDGWLSRLYNKKSNSYRYEIGIGSTSLKFLNQLSFLLSKYNISCSIKEQSPTKKQKRPFYKLRIYKTSESEKFLDKIGIYKKDENLVIVKSYNNRENTSQIKKIEVIKKESIVYDLETKSTSSFFANGIHIHNCGFTLKFCVPLIREIFFSRGSPNYIATYEEAQVLKAWSEVIEPYREHVNTHTPWYRDFNPSKPLNWRTAKEVIDEHGRKLIKGRKNTLKGLVLSKSASKGVGGGATWIFGDECFGKDTPVLMSDYSVKKIQDIKKGEFVLGVDGQPKEVINTCSGIDQMYEIQQRKGLTFIVNSKHKLVLEKRNHRLDNGIKYLTPEEYLNLDKYSLRTHYGIKNQIINYTKNDLKLNPYFLGLWLGDGSTNACEVIINVEKDVEILNFLKEYVKSIGYTYKLSKCTAPTCKMFSIKSNFQHNILTKEMKRLGIFSDKRIPLSYIETSEKDRLELLAGLIDSDGYLSKGTVSYYFSYEIGVTKKDLAEDIKLLARSLGFYVSDRTRPAKKTILKNGNVINSKEQCSIQIRGDIKRIPVKVSRKRPPEDYVKLKENNHLITSFKIQPKGLGEYYGIEIKGDSKLFLLEDFTVVHNCGVNPVLSKFKGYINSMMYFGNVKTGTVIFSGAVGELKNLEAGLKDYMVDPEKHGFYSVDNIWDKDNEFAGRKSGFFVPESWAYFGVDDDPESEYYGQPFIDEHGNSFIERAEEYIKKRRLGLIPGINKVADKFDISQAPLTLAECFQYRGENVFPLELLQPQIEKVERRELHGVYVDLYETSSKEIKHKILDKYTYKPILEHPIDPTSKDKDGVIQVWEFPPPNKASYGVYWAGVDIVRDSISVNSPSLNVIHIYKGSHNMESEYKEKILVAKYMGRPKDKMDWFKKAIMLMEWYNAEALVENNVNWFIEEAIKIQKQHKIAKTPQWVKDMTPQGTSYMTKPYGVVMTPKLMEKILDSIAKYLKEPLHTEYNEETGEPTIHYGVERINDLQLLRELVNYRPKKEYEKGNYDSVISTGLALLQAEYNEVRGVIPKDAKENTNFNQKSAKLMLRNRFSHSNLKKLLNVNNIQQ